MVRLIVSSIVNETTSKRKAGLGAAFKAEEHGSKVKAAPRRLKRR
jgi:hypothetical protein